MSDLPVVLWMNIPCNYNTSYEQDKKYRAMEYSSCLKSNPWLTNCSKMYEIDNHQQMLALTTTYASTKQNVIQVFNGCGIPRDNTSYLLYRQEEKNIDDLTQDIKQIVGDIKWTLIFGQSYSYMVKDISSETFNIHSLTSVKYPSTFCVRRSATSKHYKLNAYFQ